jgi:outer membrane protein assembly factor BamC
MKISHLTVLSLAILTLTGCSSLGFDSKRVDYKAAAVKVSSLDVPPDLTVPTAEDHYTIPDGGAAAANYSDFAKGGGASPAGTNSVLPAFKAVHLMHNGPQRWLVVDDKAENVWPVIKSFLQDNGFVIKTENPQAGIFETDWAENRANIPKDGIRKYLGKVLDALYDSGTRDMYRVRLERTNDGAGTEVYLTQYGKEEVLTADKNSTKWQTRANDPELEATMLQILVTRLGGADTLVKADSDTRAAQGTGAAQLLIRSNGKKSILLSEPFDRSWRTVGLALEHEGFVVEDKDRTKGLYLLHIEEKAKTKSLFDKLSFWKKQETATPARYQVNVHEAGSGCEVEVTNGNGESDANTQRVFDSLFKALGK